MVDVCWCSTWTSSSGICAIAAKVYHLTTAPSIPDLLPHFFCGSFEVFLVLPWMVHCQHTLFASLFLKLGSEPAQASLIMVILLPQLPKCWYYTHSSPCLAVFLVFSALCELILHCVSLFRRMIVVWVNSVFRRRTTHWIKCVKKKIPEIFLRV